MEASIKPGEAHSAVVARAGLSTAEARWERAKMWLSAAGFRMGRTLHGLARGDVAAAVGSAIGADILSHLCRDASLRVDTPTARGAQLLRTDSWVFEMVRRRQYAEYPLLYCLLLRAIGVSVERYFSELPGDAADPKEEIRRCVNPVCDSPIPPFRRVVKDARTGSTVPRAPRVEVGCPTCGYQYTAPASNDCPNSRRLVKTGPLWDVRLKQLVDARASRTDITRALGLAELTVQRRAYALDVWHPGWGPSTRERVRRLCDAAAARADQGGGAARGDPREAYRQRWLALRAAHPDASRSELKSYDAAVYAHLRGYDSDWFAANNVPPREKAPSRSPIDWAGRDDSIVPCVRTAVAELRSRPGTPVRVTATTVLRTLRDVRCHRHWLPHLPGTRAILGLEVEDGDAFARRRIEYHARAAASRNEVVSRDKLCDRAHLSASYRSRHRELIEYAVRAVRGHVEHGIALPAHWGNPAVPHRS